MKNKVYFLILTFFIATILFANPIPKLNGTKLSFPYTKMGLNKKQATVHLLNRFTYGIKPGDINNVLQLGLENWFKKQLTEIQDDNELNQRLSGYDALTMSNEMIVNSFIPMYEIKKILKLEGINIADSNFEKPTYKAIVDSFMKVKNIRLPGEYQRQLINRKILGAVYSKNQLNEILTDFWFNHFNVSLSKNQCAMHVLTFERDVIKPHILGNFEDLLIATAKSPAMLEFLDNNYSVSFNNNLSKLEYQRRINKTLESNSSPMQDSSIIKMIKQRREQGLNENYARELLELHTLGVDGGYTQSDVTEVARIFSGWSVVPMLRHSEYRKTFDKSRQYNIEKLGFVVDGNFLYRANRHDDSIKNILNYHFPSNGGYDEGVDLLKKLANHPSTAKFICKKIATKFVSDNPSAELIDNMAKTFIKSKGNIKQVLISMVNSDEFWDQNSVKNKVKTPFELTISAIRATNAEVKQPYQISNWCSNMGQKFYNYQAPTGFPDRSDYWVNTSSLLTRMNFGLAFSSSKLPGIKMDAALINNNYEPESINAAIQSLSELLLPEVNSEKNFNRVLKLVSGNELTNRLDVHALNQKKINTNSNMLTLDNTIEYTMDSSKEKNLQKMNTSVTNDKLTQIVGLLLGSPEFQKR